MNSPMMQVTCWGIMFLPFRIVVVAPQAIGTSLSCLLEIRLTSICQSCSEFNAPTHPFRGWCPPSKWLNPPRNGDTIPSHPHGFLCALLFFPEILLACRHMLKHRCVMQGTHHQNPIRNNRLIGRGWVPRPTAGTAEALVQATVHRNPQEQGALDLEPTGERSWRLVLQKTTPKYETTAVFGPNPEQVDISPCYLV